MTRLHRGLAGYLSTLAIIAGSLLLCSTPAAWAQDKAGIKKQLVGTWMVTSQYVDQDGKKAEPFGASPKGMFVFDSLGNVSIIIMRPGLAKVASNNRMTATADENKAMVQGSLAYYGKYTVNEKDSSINVKIDQSSFPNWTGEDQKRLITIKGDELHVTNPTVSIGSGTAHIFLKRAK